MTARQIAFLHTTQTIANSSIYLLRQSCRFRKMNSELGHRRCLGGARELIPGIAFVSFVTGASEGSPFFGSWDEVAGMVPPERVGLSLLESILEASTNGRGRSRWMKTRIILCLHSENLQTVSHGGAPRLLATWFLYDWRRLLLAPDKPRSLKREISSPMLSIVEGCAVPRVRRA